MDLLNETVLLKTKSTLFNLLSRETSQFLCYERLLNMTMWHRKMHFSAKCNSGRIAIQWFHIKHYLDYQYTKFQPYTFRVQKMCVFARYATLVPRLFVMVLRCTYCLYNPQIVYSPHFFVLTLPFVNSDFTVGTLLDSLLQ